MSTFRPDTSGLSFRFACSVELLGGRGAADKCHWRVWGALAVSRPHWACTPLTVCVLPRLHGSGSRLLSRERAPSYVHFPGLSHSDSGFRVLHKDADSVGPAFCAFPARAAQAATSLTSALSPGVACIVPSTAQPQFWARRSGTPCVCSELDSRCDPSSGCRPSSISGSL